jgi:hypothetical protein
VFVAAALRRGGPSDRLLLRCAPRPTSERGWKGDGCRRIRAANSLGRTPHCHIIATPDENGDGAGALVQQRMYQLVRQHGPIIYRVFSIEFLDRAVEAFAFTFG